MRQLGVAGPGVVAHLGLRKKSLRDAINWLVITHCPNVYNEVNRATVLQEVANLVGALTPILCETS